MVRMYISADISYVAYHESYFRSWMENRLKLRSTEMLKLLKKQLSQAEKHNTEFDRVYIKIYEDNAAGRLSDERFSMMGKIYRNDGQKTLNSLSRWHRNTRIWMGLFPSSAGTGIRSLCGCPGQIKRTQGIAYPHLL